MTKTAPPVPTSFAPSSAIREAASTRWALAAAAGLCLAGCNQSEDKPTGEKAAASSPTSEKACCQGKNDCKGKGGCAVPGKNDCAGKNSCKGQGGCNMNCPK
jgi:hypothetical protein